MIDLHASRLLKSALRLAVPAMLLLALGCGEEQQSAPVSGRVTLNGQPLSEIRVFFHPAGDPSRDPTNVGMGSYGLTDADGRFTLQFTDDDRPGALVGKHNVTFADKLTESADDTDDAGFREEKPSRIPAARSAEPTTFDVPPGGTDQANFELGTN